MDFWRKTKGAVSIFLVIILVPMMTVSSLFVDASKVKLAKAMMESAGDLTLNTALTEYDTKLKELYGLLATAQDTSDLFSKLEDYYRTCITSSGVSNEDAQTYVEQIMAQLGIVAQSDDTADIMNMELVDFEVQKYPSGNLANATVLEKQIVDFMKYRAPINTGLSFISSLKSFSTLSKQSELVEKKQDFYEEQQTVLENLQSAWKEIAGYNNSAFVKDPNYLSGMKTKLGTYGESYKDYGKRTIMSLYKKYDPIVKYTFLCNVDKTTQAKDSFDFSTGKHTGNEISVWRISYSGATHYSYLSEYYTNSYNTNTPKLPSIDEVKSALTGYYNAQKTAENKNAPHYESNYYSIQFFAKKKGEIEPYISAEINYFIAYQKLKNILTWIDGYDSVTIEDSDGNRITPTSIKNTDLTIGSQTKKISAWLSELSIDSVYENHMSSLKANTDEWNSRANDAKAEYYAQFSITSDTDISTAVNRISIDVNAYVKTLDDSIKHLEKAIGYLNAAKTQLNGPVAAAKQEWSNVASDTAISDTSLAKQDQAEISQLDTYLNDTNITKLITRLENVKSDLTTVLSQVKEYKFADVFIGDIDGYSKLEEVCGNKWNDLNSLSIVKDEISNTATSRASGAWHSGNVNLDWTKQSMHQPDLTQDKVSMYTYLSSHFAGTEPADSSPSTNVTEEDTSNGKDLYKNIKDKSESTANGQTNGSDSGQASASTKDNNISTKTGIPSTLPDIKDDRDTPSGSVNTKIDKSNGEKGAAGKSAGALNGLFGKEFLSSVASFGTDLRDKLYVADYVMSMFSYDTIENEYKVKNGVDSIEPGMILSLTKNDISKDNNYAYGSEVEYIIYGGTNSQNLIKSYGSIYAIRFGFNLVYAFATSEIRESALAIATPISAATLGVIPVPLIQAVIIIGIACCESAIDLCDLRDGQSVPLYKSSKTWHCSITGLTNVAKGKVGKIIKETSSALIDEGVNELNNLLDMSEEELNKKIKEGTNKITDSVERAYDQIITENANAAIQQLSTLVTSAVESVRCLDVGESYSTKKAEMISWIKNQLQNWSNQQSGDGLAAKVKREAVKVILDRSDSFINGLFDILEKQIKSTSAGSTIDSILNGASTVDGIDRLGGEVMEYITSIRNTISREIVNGSDEIQSYIKTSKDKVSASMEKGADELKSTLNESIDGIFGTTTGGGESTGMASFFSFSYSDYMRLFLLIGLITNEQKVILRTADVIQVNMSEQVVHGDYSLVESAAYVKVYAKVMVKPTLLPLPLFANVENNPSTNSNWYTIEYNGISGY